MSAKLASCTLAVMYRQVHPDGHISGGPMYYLENGLAKKGLAPLGKTLAVVFAMLTLGGSLGGGNMFQANQTIEVLGTVSSFFHEFNWAVGLLLAFLVGIVIIGGIRRIGKVTSRLVPAMCSLYVITAVIIILAHIGEVPSLLGRIVTEAFTGPAIYGGFLGVLVTGIKRAVFSNEAGLGSAAFVHAAAKTDEPAREGIVAMIGPFIDTVVICTMTALVCMVTGAYADPNYADSGVAMTAAAFESFFPGARYVPFDCRVPVCVLYDDFVVLLWRACLGVSLRHIDDPRLPVHLCYVRLHRIRILSQQRHQLLRYDDPRNGFPEHHRRHHPQPADQSHAQRILATLSVRRDANLQIVPQTSQRKKAGVDHNIDTRFFCILLLA